ncbi:MAG: hypothetical protein A4E65_00229 [Syntrophorhabdus sp. PtaU1.Bin153]|nr:MAG: hypothetical protein A4E65_00229 [Syntrophorhabdus sp. PtaU1.Bin153]
MSGTNKSGNRTKQNHLNRRAAIRERCLNCQGGGANRVTECDHDDCPLHPFRTGTGKQNPTDRKEGIKAYCLWCMCGDRKEVNLCPSTSCPLFPYRKGGLSRL